MNETRDEMIQRWEKEGRLNPDCRFCQDEYYAKKSLPSDVFAPRHEGSKNCESGSLASGGRNSHCTCDTCF